MVGPQLDTVSSVEDRTFVSGHADAASTDTHGMWSQIDDLEQGRDGVDGDS